MTDIVASKMKIEKWISVEIVWRKIEGHEGVLNRINISRNRNGKIGRN